MSTSRIDVREILVTGLIVEDEALVVDLDDGRTITVPLAWFPRLSHGTAFERANWHLIAGGEGIHWPELDEDISVASLLSGGRSGETQESFRSWLETRKVPKPLSTAGKVHLSPADHDRLKRDLGQFTVALFGGPGLFMGSGTLVEVADSHYILTAAHVWRKLK
jgi:hypothetical protein